METSSTQRIQSDIVFDGGIFSPDRVPETTSQINSYLFLQSLSAIKGQEWWEIGAGEFRRLQDAGKTAWPAPTYRAPNGSYIQIPSRESGRKIKCRVVPPPSSKPDGVLLKIHGGGNVLCHCDWRDELCEVIAEATNLTVVSPEFRLAPEQPFPCGLEDVFDVAEYLVDNSPAIYGGPLKFIAGESEGSTLGIQTFLHLLDARPGFSLQGVVLAYGLYDWSLSPSCNNWSTPLMMRTENVKRYREAYLGDRSTEDLRDPAISPIYHPIFRYPGSQVASLDNLSEKPEKERVKLPPALFLCGTLDLTVDDTVMMSFKWQVAGGDAVVKFIEGAPHSYQLFPLERYQPAVFGRKVFLDWLKERL